MMSKTDEPDRQVACNRVAGVVVTGNEDGAHHVISESSGALADPSYTIPGRAWTYWHLGLALARLPRRRARSRLVAQEGPRHGREPVRRGPRALAATPLNAPLG
ncbi:hypothetical protein ACFZAU_25300 [Streptomyces sp. NPDC008238]